MKGGLEGERQSQEGESEECEWLKSGLQLQVRRSCHVIESGPSNSEAVLPLLYLYIHPLQLDGVRMRVCSPLVGVRILMGILYTIGLQYCRSVLGLAYIQSSYGSHVNKES